MKETEMQSVVDLAHSDAKQSTCPTFFYNHILWHSLPNEHLLRVIPEERDVMERQWKQNQPELYLAQARPGDYALSRH